MKGFNANAHRAYTFSFYAYGNATFTVLTTVRTAKIYSPVYTSVYSGVPICYNGRVTSIANW